MKKTSILIITTVLVFSLLTACSNKENNAKSPSPIDVSKISAVADFSNGLTFVQYNDDQNTYCVDKAGKQLFNLEKCNINNFAKFNEKIAMIETTDNGFILCDKKGKTYNAEDFNASRIVLDTDNHKLAFLDGYIILERKEESYDGTKVEMSIINSDFTTLVPFSVELAEIINSDIMSVNGTGYYDGYLYNLDLYGTGATILDLRTGTQLSDTKQMKVSKPLHSYLAAGTYGSNFENVEQGDIYNALTGEVIAKVKEKESISQISFVGDIGLATYDSDNGMWFNIIEKNGITKFEPIKIGDSEIEFDGKTILILSQYQTEKDNVIIGGLSLKTYDICGNLLGEIILEEESYYGMVALGNVKLNDGVIEIYNMTTKEYLFYNSNLEKLF